MYLIEMSILELLIFNTSKLHPAINLPQQLVQPSIITESEVSNLMSPERSVGN
jgi:hypothetical protein